MSRPRPKINPLLRGSSRGALRAASAGSFHAGAPIPTISSMRRATMHRYQTFPQPPPKTTSPPNGNETDSDDTATTTSDADDEPTPLPVKQLLLLAFLSLSEQTALNSISPYLPQMVKSMPGIPMKEDGLYVGILASSFALAQLSTNFMWGYASDVVGRKPVLLVGTFSLMCCFCAFGFCKEYWQVVMVHVAMGLLNGNAACVPTVLGEVTDRSNQSKAFTYLPIIYSLGSITGPAVGGILVGKLGNTYPYLAPNLLGAAMLAISVIVVGIWFEETLDKSESDPGMWTPTWLDKLTDYMRGSKHGSQSGTQPLLSSDSDSADEDDLDDTQDLPNGYHHYHRHHHEEGHSWRDLLNHTTILILVTYLVFQLSNISYNSLYPIFAATDPPTGRDLNPSKIGVSLSLAGVATIVFQSFLFQPLKARLGNLGSYRYALFGIAVSMVLMPWVGYVDDKPLFGLGTGRMWLYIELGVILILKNICAVGGLSSVMLLITNSAPSHASLGTLNGIAQTLSAAGRSIGPFVSGGLFTLSVDLRPKGEALAWCIFGGLAFFGGIGSLFIRGEHLESEDWHGDAHHDDEES